MYVALVCGLGVYDWCSPTICRKLFSSFSSSLSFPFLLTQRLLYLLLIQLRPLGTHLFPYFQPLVAFFSSFKSSLYQLFTSTPLSEFCRRYYTLPQSLRRK